MHFDYEKESGVSATIIFKPTTTINTRTASSLAQLQLTHHLQALLPEQIPIALQQTTLEEASQTLPTPIIGRAAARRADKVLAATTEGKLKTTTQTTTNACKQTISTVSNSNCKP